MMKELNAEQTKFLLMILSDFIDNYDFIPAMRYSKLEKKWPRQDIIGYIHGLLRNREYQTGIDADWLYDLREFYIQEKKKETKENKWGVISQQ